MSDISADVDKYIKSLVTELTTGINIQRGRGKQDYQRTRKYLLEDYARNMGTLEQGLVQQRRGLGTEFGSEYKQAQSGISQKGLMGSGLQNEAIDAVKQQRGFRHQAIRQEYAKGVKEQTISKHRGGVSADTSYQRLKADLSRQEGLRKKELEQTRVIGRKQGYNYLAGGVLTGMPQTGVANYGYGEYNQ